MNSPLRILVVDDDTDIRQICACVLTGSGYQVDTAADGAAGWKAMYASSYESYGYDLLITDYNMPKLSGVGLIQKVRSARLALPVILASGEVPGNTEELRLAALLRKPYSAGQLLDTVIRVLHTSSPAAAGAGEDLSPGIEQRAGPITFKNKTL